MKYVIIGNSAAGIAAAEEIRARDKEGEVVILSDEKYPVYGRPLISYYLLGATDRERMNYRSPDFYEKNNFSFRPGTRAEKIDVQAKVVLLSGGEKIKYDKLLVATGSRPFTPPIAGLEKVKKRFSFMTLDDALSLEKALAGKKKRVFILGAGLIGLKCLEGIADRANGVAVADMAGHILPSILDEAGAAVVQRTLGAHGAEFYLNDSVAEFEENAALLKSGRSVPFDVLVTAVGVRPNTELVKEAGGQVRRGIVIDDHMRTSLPDVYAAGDCTESRDIVSGEYRILALLPNARFQGRCAGADMAGGDEAFDTAFAMNAIGFFGTHVLTAGCYAGEEYTEAEGDTYKKLFIGDNVLNGFILVNEPECAGIYTDLIRRRTPLSEVDFALLEKAPQLRAFSAKARAGMLAKEV